jgi:hypothetical protein
MHKIVFKACKILKLTNAVDLTVHVGPLVVRLPRSWVRVDLYFSSWTSQDVSPFFFYHFVVSLQNFHGQQQREQKFMFFEETSADVLVERVGKVLVEVL